MRATVFAFSVVAFALAGSAGSAAAQEFTLAIRDHKFEPSELRVPANKRVSIVVTNEDPTPEEFESVSMKVEKIIPGKSKGLVRVGPLTPGRYDFFGDFNQATAQGILIAE